MNLLHLFWIIPLVVGLGFILAALIGANTKTEGDHKMAVLYFRNENGEFVEVPTLQGPSAYEVAVANGFEGTEAEWLESLKPKKGVDYWTDADKAEIIAAVIAQLPDSGGDDSGGSGDDSGGSGTTSYTTTVTLDGVTLYSTSAQDAAPNLRITVFDSGFHIQNASGTAKMYTYNYTGSDTFLGVYSIGKLYEPGTNFATTTTAAQDIQIDLTLATSSSSGGSSGGDSSGEYYTTIQVDGADYYTTLDSTAGASPLLTITVGRTSNTNKLYFRAEYENTQLCIYTATSTEIVAFNLSSSYYYDGDSFIIGGETGQDTVVNITEIYGF